MTMMVKRRRRRRRRRSVQSSCRGICDYTFAEDIPAELKIEGVVMSAYLGSWIICEIIVAS